MHALYFQNKLQTLQRDTLAIGYLPRRTTINL